MVTLDIFFCPFHRELSFFFLEKGKTRKKKREKETSGTNKDAQRAAQKWCHCTKKVSHFHILSLRHFFNCNIFVKIINCTRYYSTHLTHNFMRIILDLSQSTYSNFLFTNLSLHRYQLGFEQFFLFYLICGNCMV